LLQLAKLPRTRLEQLENLEQLRALEHGYEILVGLVDEPTIGIDTPADYAAFVERYRVKPQASQPATGCHSQRIFLDYSGG